MLQENFDWVGVRQTCQCYSIGAWHVQSQAFLCRLYVASLSLAEEVLSYVSEDVQC